MWRASSASSRPDAFRPFCRGRSLTVPTAFQSPAWPGRSDRFRHRRRSAGIYSRPTDACGFHCRGSASRRPFWISRIRATRWTAPTGAEHVISAFVGRGLAPADSVTASSAVRSVGLLPISEGFGTVGNRPLRIPYLTVGAVHRAALTCVPGASYDRAARWTAPTDTEGPGTVGDCPLRWDTGPF